MTSVEELIVTTGPILHVGCAKACWGVTSVSSWRFFPLKGPPEAVRTSWATSLLPVTREAVSPFSCTPLSRHCAIAECSESTGTICPGRRIRLRTKEPPTTKDSLFARARVAPASSAASVGPRPTPPVIPFKTTARGKYPAICVEASTPWRISGTMPPFELMS